MRSLPFSPNPEIEQLWCNSKGEARLFEPQYYQGKKNSVFLPEIQRSFSLRGPKIRKETFYVVLNFLVSETVALIYEEEPDQ